ncbi:MAG TPA: hypothetical protein VFH77_16305 [Streptomyces sp.]|nr:hypothetical protein [Streptomyces sp.]
MNTTQTLQQPAVNVQFVEPAPPVPRRPESIHAFAEAVKDRPGVWALFGVQTTPACARQNAYMIRRALRHLNEAFGPAGSFEAEARTIFGEWRVYTRYVGHLEAVRRG